MSGAILNVIPELLGLALLMKAWLTLAVLLPLYLAALGVRIRQEERAMRDACPGY